MGEAMNAAEGAVSFWIARGNGGGDKLYYGSDDTRGDGGGGANELHLDMSPHGSISVFIRGRNGADVHFATTGEYGDNAWHHVTATWNAKRTTLHIDGGALAGGETVTGPGSDATFTFRAVHRFGAPAAASRADPQLRRPRRRAGRLEHDLDRPTGRRPIPRRRPEPRRTHINHQPTPESETADR